MDHPLYETVRIARLWLLLLSLAALLAVLRANNDEFCPMYYGGLVFPDSGRRTVEHGLHWSKTQIGKPAPDWNGTAVINAEFQELRLADFKGKYLVFFFYPLDFFYITCSSRETASDIKTGVERLGTSTFVCPTEILAFSDRVDEFEAINTKVVACSVDSKYTHFAWINTPRDEGGLKGLRIPLLSDLTKQISKDYGVLLEDEGHTLRGLFIIDHRGVLRQITMNDLPVGRSVDETLRLVQAFQYTDKKGEVCPAGWQPGGKTIKPDPVGKREYFAEQFCEDPAKGNL